jgi:hypothetical protein
VSATNDFFQLWFTTNVQVEIIIFFKKKDEKVTGEMRQR